MSALCTAAIWLLSGAAVIAEAAFTPQYFRGVGPIDAKAYKARVANEFKCLDGKARIDMEAVNDDFCDCKDGSDEPGTAACAGNDRGRAAQALFYCKNEGSRPRYIYRSRVMDGICDCCDGSDEHMPGGESVISACQDACDEETRPFREAEERKKTQWQKAVDLMHDLAEVAESKVDAWQKEIPRLTKEIPELKKAKEALKKKYEDAEQNLQRKIESGRRDRAEDVEEVEATPSAAASSGRVSEYAKWMEGGDAVTTTTTTDIFADFKAERDGFDKTRRIVHKKKKEFQLVEDKFWAAKYRLKGLEVTSSAALSGKKRALADLDGTCLSKEEPDEKLKQNIWNFTVCFYRSAKRAEVGQEEENKNNLGRWMRWDFKPMPVAIFERGDVCSTPNVMNIQRELKVIFSCGMDVQITSVKAGECKHTMKATHPGACENTSPPAPEKQPEGPILPHHGEL